jgi:uncharacterized protein YbjQ (UPF0145 family)
MIIVSTLEVPGREVAETLGVVRGNTVRGAHLGRDIKAMFKNLVGGEIEEYTKLLAEAREQSLDRMVAEAIARGADAVINVRFATSQITSGAAEFLAYGTAVKLK